ncbi:WD40 repeat-like protein [Wolfiporia cocos MD-104 SS10]|uniref:WD40 repeat-like protein n=1 Tax=Wolfiporia cocos (strain MD-104) TaxID=742152 RepID=A0A2H3JI43_WOLCO|nr:WD40 repeat-like protein [Wolfiporia cocos MD-104 SS10]
MAAPAAFRSYYSSRGEEERTPRFSNFYYTSLGSPFLTTSDLSPDFDTPLASASDMHVESPRNFVADAYDGAELEAIDGAFAAVPRSQTVTRAPSPSPSFRTGTYSVINWNSEVLASDDNASLYARSGRRTFSGYQYGMPNGASLKSSKSISLGIIPRLLDALRDGSPGRRKRRPSLPWREYGPVTDGEYIDYMNMPPLDGEEGELVDDEACFIDATRITGIDIVGELPTELALYLLSYLDLPAVLACLRVSRTWNYLCYDNSVWCSLFAQRRSDGWEVDLRRARTSLSPQSRSRAHRYSFKISTPAPLEIDWYETYRARAELDRRWTYDPQIGSRVGIRASLEASSREVAYEPTVRRLSGHEDRCAFQALVPVPVRDPYGDDSVYCLEFDSRRIITGSRDRTIKVWSLKTGVCLATFKGHRMSVLCLKFDKDWDLFDDGCDDALSLRHYGRREDWDRRWRRGFMVSGSSDCSVCVWELCSRPVEGAAKDADWEISAQITNVLKGHTGGVLDLKIDANWIVSCSKDTVIRVWDRRNLQLHCTFSGHEGPVNAVGLQGNRVVSASGDGKMMMWDITNRQRLQVFEGHDRGLACIEFKDDYIVSGSNDCKIKIWSASAGTCLRTLAGHDMLVRALAFDPRTGRLVSSSYDRTVKVWDLHSGTMLREFTGCHASHIFDVKFDHSRIVSTSHDRKIVVLDFSGDLDVSLFV